MTDSLLVWMIMSVMVCVSELAIQCCQDHEQVIQRLLHAFQVQGEQQLVVLSKQDCGIAIRAQLRLPDLVGLILLDCLPYLLGLQATERGCIRVCSCQAARSGCCHMKQEPQAEA